MTWDWFSPHIIPSHRLSSPTRSSVNQSECCDCYRTHIMLSKSGETIHNNNNVESCLFYVPRDHVLSPIPSNHFTSSSRSIFYYLDKCTACLLGYMLVLLVCLPLNARQRNPRFQYWWSSRGFKSLLRSVVSFSSSWVVARLSSVLVSSRVVLLWIKHITIIIIISPVDTSVHGLRIN